MKVIGFIIGILNIGSGIAVLAGHATLPRWAGLAPIGLGAGVIISAWRMKK